MLAAAGRPHRFGRQLWLLTPTVDHHVALRIGLQLAVVVSIIGYVCTGYAQAFAYVHFIYDFLVPVLLTFIWTMMLVVVITLGGASFIGLVTSWVFKRNLLPVAIQGSCYLIGLLVIWTPVVWVLLYLLNEPLNLPGRTMNWAANLLGIEIEVFTVRFSVAVNALALLIYLALLWRICAAARYANR